MTDYQAGHEGGEYLYPGSGDPAPRVGAKVQLLTIGGVHTNGPWRDDGSCLGWLPLPKRNMEKEYMTDKITIEREPLERAVTALVYHQQQTRPIERTQIAIRALRAALAAQPAEPVAWRRYSARHGWIYEDGITSFANDPSAEPLYAAPPAPAAVPPFSNAQLDRLYANSPEHHKDATSAASFKRIVKLAERAHGIAAAGEKPC